MRNIKIINDFLRILQQPRQREIKAFMSWASQHAIIVDSLDGLKADIEQFSCLDKFMEGKRVVFLGEEDHWIHEKSDYRLMLLRYFISRGFRYIGEELGWSDGIRVDNYLKTGNETYLERIATYGYKGALRKDRDDKPIGIMKSQSDNYPVKEYKSEQLRLIRALRDISEEYKDTSDRIHYFGFDLDTLTGGGYEDGEELLAAFKSEPTVLSILSLINRVQGETLEEEMKRLVNVLDKVKSLEDDLKKLLGETRYGILQEHIQTLYDSLKFNQIINPALDYEAVGTAMAAREEVMQRHVKFILSQMKPNDKLVLMGHNRHLSKESGMIKNAGAVSPGGYSGPSLGTYINRLLPNQVFSIWQLHEQGKGSQPYTELKKEYSSIQRTLNPILSKVASKYMITTSGVPLLEKEIDITGIYNTVFRTSIAKQADAIFFIRKVSPMKL
jgi:erythromycin esterase-like protein